MERFTLAAPFRCGRVKFLSCVDGSMTRGKLALWTIIRLELKCIAGIFGFFLFVDYLLRSAV